MKSLTVRKKCSVALLCTMLSIYFVAPLSMADELDDQLSNVQSTIEQQQNNKADAESRIQTFSEQLRVVQEQLTQAQNELNNISAQRIKTEADIALNERLIKEAQARLDKRMVVLKKRVRDIYINGKLSYLDVILGAKNFNDFANRVELLKRVINSDLELISSIKEERALIEQKKAALVESRAQILVLEKQAKEKAAVVEQKKAEQQTLLDKAQNDKATALAALNELEASSNAIREKLQAREAARKAAAAAAAAAAASSGGGGGGSSAGGGDSYVQGSGQFIWPVNGPITSPFGYRNHPIFGRQILHSGIDIGVDEGTIVHAADSGTVVYSDWMSGYGNVVIIDHGNGLSTLYGHNSALIVSEGQSVRKGQPIAYAGSTGNSTGPHVHFEVRVNGDPVDPLGYL